MAMTNAQRQAAYRERAFYDPDGLLLTRLRTLISPQAAAALDRIVAETGELRRHIVEDALLGLERELRRNGTLRKAKR